MFLLFLSEIKTGFAQIVLELLIILPLIIALICWQLSCLKTPILLLEFLNARLVVLLLALMYVFLFSPFFMCSFIASTIWVCLVIDYYWVIYFHPLFMIMVYMLLVHIGVLILQSFSNRDFTSLNLFISFDKGMVLSLGSFLDLIITSLSGSMSGIQTLIINSIREIYKV